MRRLYPSILVIIWLSPILSAEENPFQSPSQLTCPSLLAIYMEPTLTDALAVEPTLKASLQNLLKRPNVQKYTNPEKTLQWVIAPEGDEALLALLEAKSRVQEELHTELKHSGFYESELPKRWTKQPGKRPTHGIGNAVACTAAACLFGWLGQTVLYKAVEEAPLTGSVSEFVLPGIGAAIGSGIALIGAHGIVLHLRDMLRALPLPRRGLTSSALKAWVDKMLAWRSETTTAPVTIIAVPKSYQEHVDLVVAIGGAGFLRTE